MLLIFSRGERLSDDIIKYTQNVQCRIIDVRRSDNLELSRFIGLIIDNIIITKFAADHISNNIEKFKEVLTFMTIQSANTKIEYDESNNINIIGV